jgi:hypothetical protein
MTAKQEGQKVAEQRSREGGLLEAVIRDNVMTRLGRPPRLHHVQARNLFGDTYRVNVYVGDDAASAKVAHSYFLEADGDGKILTSSPVLTREYQPRSSSQPPTDDGSAAE